MSMFLMPLVRATLHVLVGKARRTRADIVAATSRYRRKGQVTSRLDRLV